MRQTWTGWDGSVWELTDPASPVRLKQGVRGLGMPPVQRYVSRGAQIAGSRWRGQVTDERHVFWPIAVAVAGDVSWRDVDADFWATMDPDRQGVWTVEHDDGTSRLLRCRFESDGDHTFTSDPTTGAKHVVYGLTLVAEQPFWEGERVVREFTAAAPVSFFAPGVVFRLDSGSTVSTATVDNPGDVPAWPLYVQRGPMTSAAVGLDGRLVEVPFPLSSGESLTVNTDPQAQTAIDGNGADRTSELGTVEFAPVPAGSSVALTITIVGSGGTASAALTPLHRRAL